MNYIDIFKKIIKEEVSRSSGNKNFVDNLFDKIKENVINFIEKLDIMIYQIGDKLL